MIRTTRHRGAAFTSSFSITSPATASFRLGSIPTPLCLFTP
uniref:Uncharacterized protein n=1 Tax=Arundo donax TaxID=35708 RepID=A0A0A9HGJ4_ARUDO